MFLSILSIPVLLLLCSYTPGVHGLCDNPQLSCNIETTTYSTCFIVLIELPVYVQPSQELSYLIEKCKSELAQTGITDTRFYVYSTDNNQTFTLDIADGMTTFYLYVHNNTISIEFSRTHINILSLILDAYNPAVIYSPYDFLNYFPSVTYLHLHYPVFNRFPYLNSTSLTRLYLNYLTLPNVVTILPSMLILPNLDRLTLWQLEEAQWYHVIPSSFDHTRIDYLTLRGIQHLYSYQFSNLTRLRTLTLREFFTNFTFEANALSGLDGLTSLYTYNLQTNLDLLSQETFPSLIRFDLRYSTVTTLEQRFFERQKQLTTIDGDYNPFHCGCEMAWVSHVTTNLGWSVSGTCETPSGLNGNSISNSSNYINCPNNQSFHCFNDTFICPPESICVNTADSAYCDCGDGYTLNGTNNLCEDINECTGTNSCEHICTNTVGSYTCSCNTGFTLQPPYSCEDTDECSTDNSCEHTCTNTVGSYTCSCNSGFTLQSDMSFCVSSGVNQPIAGTYFLLFSLLLQTLLLSLL